MGERVVKYTPMIEQYLDIKDEYKDTILFYRVGDFYEMFFDDAILASKELEIALTGKDAGVEERIPMCGVPFHAFEPYAEKLVNRGYKVGIVEQIEDPKEAKGLVKRGVIKIITPGTLDSGLNDKENNYIGSIIQIKRDYILCYSDLTTGEGYVAKFNSFDILANEILSLHIKEIVIDLDFENKLLNKFIGQNQIVLSRIIERSIPENLLTIASEIDTAYHPAIGMLINYFIQTKKQEPKYFKSFKNYVNSKYLKIDAFTKRNLEICETLRFNNKSGSLLWHLDKCETAMGSRMLHKWLDKPLMDVNLINERLDFIECFNEHYLEKAQIKEYFKSVYDLERIIGRVASGNANAKDLGWLKKSLKNIPDVKQTLACLNTSFASNLANNINDHAELFDLLDKALVDNPPLIITEGGMIKEGFDEKLDEIKKIQANSKEWILNYEQVQRENRYQNFKGWV